MIHRYPTRTERSTRVQSNPRPQGVNRCAFGILRSHGHIARHRPMANSTKRTGLHVRIAVGLCLCRGRLAHCRSDMHRATVFPQCFLRGTVLGAHIDAKAGEPIWEAGSGGVNSLDDPAASLTTVLQRVRGDGDNSSRASHAKSRRHPPTSS